MGGVGQLRRVVQRKSEMCDSGCLVGWPISHLDC